MLQRNNIAYYHHHQLRSEAIMIMFRTAAGVRDTMLLQIKYTAVDCGPTFHFSENYNKLLFAIASQNLQLL